MDVRPDFLGLLGALHEGQIDHVVVGGVAAILEGAPITTIDVDIVYRSDDENVERLAHLLDELDGRYRDPAGRVIVPTAARLKTNTINLLETRLGLLDAMQRIGPDWTYEDLLSRSRVLQVGDFETRVLELAAIIESKEAAGRDTDRAALPILRRTLETRTEERERDER